MGVGDRHDLPGPCGNISKEPAARQMKVGRRNLTGADQTGKYGMQFNNAQDGEKMASAGLGQNGIDLLASQFHAIMLDDSAGIEKTVGHAGSSG